MAGVETGRFAGGLHTVAVFKDLDAATAGVEALRKKGFAVEALSVIGKASEPLATFCAASTGRDLLAFSLSPIGDVLGAGPLVDTLDAGTGQLARAGLAAAMLKAGFQAHDGRIFEMLVEKGGVLVAVRNEPRAADALSVFHNYGGANAAIGAWAGRL